MRNDNGSKIKSKAAATRVYFIEMVIVLNMWASGKEVVLCPNSYIIFQILIGLNVFLNRKL